MARAAFLLISLLALSGCGALAITFVGANMATVIHADKTIPDMVLSEQSGKNCSLLHASRNEPYCQSAPPDPTEALAVLANNRYCYRTLGRIDCYNRPDFLASGQTRVNFANGFLPAGREPAPMAQRRAKGVPMAGIPAPAEAIPAAPAAAAMSAKEAPAPLAAPAQAAKAATANVPVQKRIDPRLTGTPVAQVPPPAALPGQGTY
jgi:hypothetical protein